MPSGFDWDKANLEHIARHGVTREEFEQVLANDPVFIETQEVAGETRTMEIGHTNKGRVLIVIWTLRNDFIRAVTSFHAPRSLRAEYDSERRKRWQ